MSRVFGRGFDLLQVSEEIQTINLPKYKKDNRKISWNDIDMGADYIEPFLSSDAQKLLIEHPIRIVKTPLAVYTKSTKPSFKDETMVAFPSFYAHEEYKREFVFLLGNILSVMNPDKNDDRAPSYDIPDEFLEVIPLLLEYLYLKKTNQEDRFSLKRLHELKSNVDSFINSYLAYNKRIANCEDIEMASYLLSEKEYDKLEQYKQSSSDRIETIIHNNLMSFSSMDATLQLIDMDLDDDALRELTDYLYKNENQNRSEVIKDLGIDTVGFKRLRKEFEIHKR